MKRFWMPVAAFALLGALLWYALVQITEGKFTPRTIPSPLIDKPLPAFRLPLLSDARKALSNSDLRGQPVMVNVWASWCVACRDEHPVLLALAQRRLIPIVGMDYKDTAADANGFLSRHGNPYDIVLTDADGSTGLNWGVYGVPETFVLDRNGVIRLKQIGPWTPDDVKNRLIPCLPALKAGKACPAD